MGGQASSARQLLLQCVGFWLQLLGRQLRAEARALPAEAGTTQVKVPTHQEQCTRGKIRNTCASTGSFCPCPCCAVSCHSWRAHGSCHCIWGSWFSSQPPSRNWLPGAVQHMQQQQHQELKLPLGQEEQNGTHLQPHQKLPALAGARLWAPAGTQCRLTPCSASWGQHGPDRQKSSASAGT